MYQYDAYDRKIVAERAEQFRNQVARRLRGEITEEEFRPLRLMNGLYLQLHAYMLRVAIPYGMLSSDQMRMLAHIARKYDRGYGHFTTRQNIQYNWPKLEEVPDLLADLASVEMHAFQTSGNCIRNVTSDEYAGAIAGEVDDPRIYGEILRQWSTLHPEFSFLPRKFKIAITGREEDRAAILVHDIGLRVKKNEDGDIGFEVFVGGGLGRKPTVGKRIRSFLPREHLLSYHEAILRIYNRIGRRDNIHMARIKIAVNSIGIDSFRDLVEKEWQRILADDPDGNLRLPPQEIARIAAHFAPHPYLDLPPESPALDSARAEDRSFDAWVRANVVPHKMPGYGIAVASIKPHGGTPGDATAEQMDRLAALADTYSFGELRITHRQNVVFADVELGRMSELWRELDALGYGTANLGLLTDSICCPGLDYCNLANARSIPLAQEIGNRFDDIDYLHDLGEIELNISGCINACGHHHVGNIGILGVNRKGIEYYQVTLGGDPTEAATVGKIIGPAFAADEVVDALARILDAYVRVREEGEPFLETYRRVGLEPFKEAAYVKPVREQAAETADQLESADVDAHS